MTPESARPKSLDIEFEHVNTVAAEKSPDDIINSVSAAEERRIVRRIDRRLVVTLGVLYCVSLMDRSNLGAAAIAGMMEDMTLINTRYSVIVLVFFVTYVLAQPPAVVAMRKVGPRLFLPTICFLWGVVMICFGFVTNWESLVGLRLLLGLLEAGYFPGCAYLLSCWYPRYDLHKRNAIFFVIGSVASAFAGLLGYATVQYQPGIAGWRWIFVLQGALTCAVAIPSYVFIVDFPELAVKNTTRPFLTQREVDFVIARLEKDRNDVHAEAFELRNYLRAGADLKVWGFAALFGLITTITYAISYFLPIILRDGMGFGLAASLCLTAPPYVLNGLVLIGTAWLSDKYRLRSPILLFNGCGLLMGLPLLGYVENVAARYIGAFMVVVCGNSSLPVILTWQANNIRGQWKRAFCSATLVGSGGVGGIIGSLVFRSQDSPAYHPGILACLIAASLILVVTLLLDWKFYRANKRAVQGGKPIEGLEGFLYTY
ncbi:phthalate transporter [Aspergillus pseudoustus]|uniref:Phthalate transporter n=1 Tax=Aspergillus pseudoustus TaxID=1810923 RepID=A0ABR4JPS4_9EURO